MMDIGIAAVANQTFFVQLAGSAYTITLHGATECVTVSIRRNDDQVVEGARIVPGTPLLPYRYQEEGNFLLLTQAEALPDHTQFGVTQFLVYLTQAEVAALRAA